MPIKTGRKNTVLTDEYLRHERLELIFDSARSNCYITFLLVLVFVFLLRPVAPSGELLVWAISLTVLSFYRIHLTSRFLEDPEKKHHFRYWKSRLFYSLALAATLWAVPATVLVRNADTTTQLLIAWFVGSVVLGSMTTLGAWFSAFALFSCLCLSLNGIGTAFRSGQSQLILTLAFFLFQPVLLVAGRLMGRVYDRSLVIRRDNLQLVQRLKVESEKAQAGERRFAALANALDVALFVRNRENGTVLYANPAAERLVGSKPGGWIGRDIHELVHPEERDLVRSIAMDPNRKEGEHLSFETRLVTSNGIVWGHVTSTISQYEGIPSVFGAVMDITPRKKAEQQLGLEKEKAQATLTSIADGVLTTDKDGAIEFINPAAENLLATSLEQIRGRRLEDVLSLRVEETGRQLKAELARWVDDPRIPWKPGGNLILMTPEGGDVPVEVTGSPIVDQQETSHGAVLALKDVSEIRSLTRLLAFQASHDPLTGLVNRREFEVEFNHLLESKNSADEHALLFIDLDQFKLVNDRGGHAAGDELLRQIGDRMSSLMRQDDLLARLGGDEFAVLMKNCPLEVAQRRAEELRKLLRDFNFSWGGHTFELGGSFGLAVITSSSGTVQEILSAADMACYVAKEQGRNRVQVYQPDDESLMAQRGQMDWQQRLQQALKEDRFALFTQEVHPLSKRIQPGFRSEILLRMLGDDGSYIAPGMFLGTAERYRLMPDIDRWVVRNTLQALVELDRFLTGFRLFGINISAQSLNETEFLPYVLEQFDHFGIPFSSVCFELTETTAISNLDRALNFLNTLRDRGCLLSLDDFGSGVSSFSYLKHLPLNSLKIDGSFVRDIRRHPQDRAVVESICQVGKVMGIRTVAEHVENAEVLSTLKEVGVDFVQGYAVHKPEPLTDWMERLKVRE